MKTGRDELQIDCEFPGGNIILEGIEESLVRVRQDLRDTEGWWFYWYFRVQGAQGRTLRFEFTDGEPIGVSGPAFSADGGETWSWLGAEAGDARSFSYHFGDDEFEVRFSFGIPYLQADWEHFLQSHRDDPRVRPDALCRSRHGREVECLYLGAPDSEPAHRVFLTSRHHCCEAMATNAMEGLLAAVLEGGPEETQWLAENVELLAVPFVDKDGAEEGDQGKNRRPRDHGRDYEGTSIYPEAKAIRELLPKWCAGHPTVTLDLHCPYIRGDHNEDIYIVGSSIERIWQEQQRLGNILERTHEGPLPYRAADNLPFGTAWNTSNNFRGGKAITRWTPELPDVRLAVSFEIPYAIAGGVQVLPDRARAFGQDLARALALYLQEEPDT